MVYYLLMSRVKACPHYDRKINDSYFENEGKTTVLLVEQNFMMASQIGDYFYIMDNGKIVHNGFMHELKEDKEMCQKYLGIS